MQNEEEEVCIFIDCLVKAGNDLIAKETIEVWVRAGACKTEIQNAKDEAFDDWFADNVQAGYQ